MLCEILTEIVKDEEQNELTVYGFRFIRKSSGEVVCILRDVFTEKERALALKERIEKNDLDASQIL
ncbi:MAG: hypothetical protein IIU58_02220, partial [Clostridia bacterium]|nr:hypothetical protein [Clostridia bacterium]